MKILLFGKGGQVGWELQRSLAPLGEVVALGTGSTNMCGNFLDLEGLAATVRAVQADVIVNAAAYTAVDKAESDQGACHAINAAAPGVLAREAARTNALLVHYSTDYVFDGSGIQPWCESDAVHPLSVYGKTKLAGEREIQASGCRHLIFRTSWVYAARGGNFAKTMLRLAAERDALAVVNDQLGAPTGADLIADVTSHAIRAAQTQPALGGLYHLVASGSTSWHGYADFVISFARRNGVAIKVAQDAISAVASDAFPTPAPRPKNSRLSIDKLQAAFGLTMPQWEDGVTRMLTELFEK